MRGSKSVFVSVCVCVCERERERGRESMILCSSVTIIRTKNKEHISREDASHAKTECILKHAPPLP